MCVAAIVLPGAKAPTLEDLRRMERQNPDGAGIAWPQTANDGAIVVAYEKGTLVSAERIHEKLLSLLRDGVGPILFHFRWATVGGKNPLLCHPFPLEPYPTLETRGQASDVMIHNGHWGDWDSVMKSNPDLFSEKDRTDHRQVWSDTRAGAHLMALGLITQKDVGGKVAVLHGSTMEVFRTGHWEKDTERNILYSNFNWRRFSGAGEADDGSSLYEYYQDKSADRPRRKFKGGTGSGSGSSNQSTVGFVKKEKSEEEYRLWWERYLDQIDKEKRASKTELVDRYRTTYNKPVHVSSYHKCYLCELWMTECRALSVEETGPQDGDSDYWVCPKCDWELPSLPSLPPPSEQPTQPTQQPLFTKEEIAAGLEAVKGLNSRRHQLQLVSGFTQDGQYDGEIRYLNGVPHWQSITGEWHPMPGD